MAFKSKIIVSCIVAIILTISQLTEITATHLPGPFDNLIQTVSDTIPFNDRQGDFINDKSYNPFDILPTELEQSVEYDLESDSYIIYEKIGDEYFRTPSTMTFNEYLEWKSKEQDQRYFNKLAGIDDGYRDASGRIDPMKKIDIEKNLVDRLFGGNGITITPQGSIDLNFGGRYTTTDNSTIQESQRNQLFFPDFGMDIKMNVDGKIGDKMDLGFNYDTNASFDFDRKIKLAYDSEKWTEDDIIKKIEAGNVSMPLRSTLIQGAQELFGIKTELQFGNLRLTGLLSQQRSEQQNIQIQNGATVQEFEIRPHEYDENRHFFISHYHRDVYEKALENMPYIDNSFRVTDIEVWISDDRPNFQSDQTIIAAIADIAETDPTKFSNASSVKPETNPIITEITSDINGRRLPDNRVNNLYETIVKDNPEAARLDQTTIVLQSLGLRPATDFETFRGRKLNSSEYYLNPELGFISLNIKLRPNQVLAVSYEYFYTNNCEDVYKVGTLADEGIISNSENIANMEIEQPEGVLFTKLIKGSSQNPFSPTWDLMMKNVYPLRANNLDQADFEFDIYFENDNIGSLDKVLDVNGMRTTPLLNLFGLDKLNSRNDPQPDGIFDFVPGVTVIPQSSSIVFPVLEPFGQTLEDAINELATDPNKDNLIETFVFNELYDSTVTLAALALEENKFVMAGKIKSSTSSEYSLGAWNIPQGSVRVSAGSFQLIEGVHYEVDYGIGRLRILDQSIVQQGVPINISFEDNSVFSLQQKNMLGLRAEYEFSENFYLGGTALKLQERPFTEKVNLGDDPINNRIYGLDMAYNTESPFVTKLVDKLPFYSTNQPSNVNFTAEVAALKPGHNSAINSNNEEDAGGVVSLDDFEGAVSGFPLSSQPNRWVLCSPPQIDEDLFPEAFFVNDIRAGVNRAKLSWYVIDRFVNLPESDKDNNSFTRRINQTELFQRQIPQGQLPDLLTFDMTYYPNERGPYNYDLPNGYPGYSAGLAGLDPNQEKLLLNAPETRWAGIMRYLSNNDFQAANYQFIEFWLLNPYNEKPDGSPHIDDEEGFLTFHLGNVSEDILPDNNQFYENANPASETAWGRVPLQAPINDAFVGTDFSPQDLGLDGLTDGGERDKFQGWINEVEAEIVLPPEVRNDPAGDNYVYFNDQVYDASDNLLERYRNNNSPQNNSPNVSEVNTFQRGNPIPDKEDLNNNKALDASEKFHQYRIKLKQDGNTGFLDESDPDFIKYVTDKREINAGPAGDRETWYRFRIPLDESEKINGIEGFRSIQFLRLLVNGFQTQKTFRMAEFELVRNQWRKEPSICNAGQDGVIENPDQIFNIDVVGVEENTSKEPFGYQLPPGIIQERLIGTFSQINQDENSLVMRFEELPKNCEASIVKLTEIDLRTFKRMQMFVHCEDPAQRTMEERQLESGDISAFIRIGKDFTSHYYEYEIPLQVSDNDDPMATNQREVVWPAANKFNFALDIFTQVKKLRNVSDAAKTSIFEVDSKRFNEFAGLQDKYESINQYAGPSETIDVEQEDIIFLPEGHKVRIIGNPNLGKIKGINVGVRNISDKDIDIDGEVWINELRLAGLLERGGVAGLARMDIQMADLGNLTASTSYSSIGWGAIDQKVNERAKEEVIEFDVATNLALGKFFPQNWGIQLPFYAQYAQSIVNPEFDAYDFDITVEDEFDLEQDGPLNPDLPSVSERNQTVNTIKTFNFTNVRKERSKPKPKRSSSVGGRNKVKNATDEKFTEKAAKKPKKPMPWDIENLSTSYSYTEIEYRDPIFSQDNSVTQSLGLDYAYSRRGSYIEPFKKVKSKHLKLIKEFNFNPIPTSFAFNSTIDRYFSTRTYRLPVTPAFEFNDRRFEWERRYDLNWNFTKALKLTFSAFNESYIDEARQEGIAATPEERQWFAFEDNGSGNLVKTDVTTQANASDTYANDYWKDNLRSGGRNTHYDHSIALNYTLPLKYLPYMDWVDIKAQYRSDYSWDAAPLISFPTGEPLAGVIQNGQNRSLTANLKFDKLYNKSKYLKSLDKPRKQSQRKKRSDKNKDSVTISKDKDGKKVTRKKSREVSTLERILVRPILMLRSARLTYKEDFSTVIPGYTGAPQFFGLDSWDSPGQGFVLGLQPDISTFTDNNSNGVFDLGVDTQGNPDNYLDEAATKGWITNSTGLNQEVIQLKGQNIEAKFKLEPWKDFKVDLDFKKSYRTTHSEVFKFIDKEGAVGFQHLAGRDLGSFDMTYYNLNTLFGVHVDSLFQTFEQNRSIISRRLDNSATAGLHELDGSSYAEGYGKVSSSVLVPAFLAAYTDRNPNDIELSIEDQVRSRSFIPKPNWKLTYNGLSKLPWFKDVFSSFTLEHGYSNQLRVSRFNTNVEYDAFNPFEERKQNGNYYTRIEIPAVQISENFNPVIGLKMKTRSDFTMEFQYNKSRDLNLKINTSSQLEEDRKESLVFGVGYTFKDSKFLKKKKSKRSSRSRSDRDKDDEDEDDKKKKSKKSVTSDRGSDMTFMLNVGYTDNAFYVHELDVIEFYDPLSYPDGPPEDKRIRGSRVFQINPTVDYILNDNVTLRAFFDFNQNRSFGTSPFTRKNFEGGITVRMTLK